MNASSGRNLTLQGSSARLLRPDSEPESVGIVARHVGLTRSLLDSQIFTDPASTIGAMQIHEVVTAPEAAWQIAYVERL
jgi:hypothetical protein